MVPTQTSPIGTASRPEPAMEPALFDDGLRALQALTAETGDHLWRSIEDATLTMILMSKARSPMQAFDILGAYQKRALDEQSQHFGHITAMYARAFESTLRNVQTVIARG